MKLGSINDTTRRTCTREQLKVADTAKLCDESELRMKLRNDVLQQYSTVIAIKTEENTFHLKLTGLLPQTGLTRGTSF